LQILTRQDGDRVALAGSGLTIYAIMENSIIAEGSEAAILKTGLSYRKIETIDPDGTFYLAYPPGNLSLYEARRFIGQYGQILAEDHNTFFIQVKSRPIDYLLDHQFHLAAVSRRPIVPSFTRPYYIPPAPSYNPVIKWIIDQITVGEVSGMLRDLTGERPTTIRGRLDTIVSRYTTNVKNSSAIWYFYERASSYMGIDSVRFHPFTWSSYTDSNIVVTKIGRVYPRQQYILCAHIDCVPSSGRAPGADDNGTSTIAVLIGAKVTARIPFKRTIKFIAFNAEEQGIYGSARYASEARARGDSILGALNGEMLGYNIRSRDSANAAHGNRAGSRVLTQRFYEMDTTYHIGLNIRQQASTPGGSDHQSFWNNGYEAACFWEWVLTPYYHTANDRITTLDTVFMTKMIKCLVATICDLAEPDTVFAQVVDEKMRDRSSGIDISILPNPARRSAEISYHLPRGENVLIEIYDRIGRRLVRWRRSRPAGDHHLIWDGYSSEGNPAPSGVYFVKLVSGKEAKVQRFVLLR
ncbi:MAG: M28 family peptidase, partial [candidate division WOR-3 bacterium]